MPLSSSVARSVHLCHALEGLDTRMNGRKRRRDAVAPQQEIQTWAEQETRRRAAEHTVAGPVDLGPPERYDDEYTPIETLLSLRPDADPDATGPRSQTVRSVICGRCAGWARSPRPEEVYEAMRAANRSRDQRSAIGVLTREADFEELMNAHLEGAFTWRQLVRAFQERQLVPRSRAGFLRRFAQR